MSDTHDERPQARVGDWMQTASGRQYWPLDPRAEDVNLSDIAHHLSNLCRFCGATSRFYSVAEHSVGVLHVALSRARHLDARPDKLGHLAKHAILHDAPEAYCHDLIRPIKRCVEGYAEVEAANMRAIEKKFDIGTVGEWAGQLINDADNAMLLAEQKLLMGEPPVEWATITVPAGMMYDAYEWLRSNEQGWAPARAKSMFLMHATGILHR